MYADVTLIRLGLLRLNFLMDSCPPGSLPDPQFLNTILLLVRVLFFRDENIERFVFVHAEYFRMHQLLLRQHFLLNVLILCAVVR